MPYDTSQGILFKFNSVAYTATSVSVSKSAGEFNVTSLDIPAGTGCLTRYRAGGLRSVELKVDWVGNTLPPTDQPYNIEFAGSGPGAGTGLTGGQAMPKAIASGVTITAQAGELLKGSATFKVTVD
jgi:hypothetical protein